MKKLTFVCTILGLFAAVPTSNARAENVKTMQIKDGDVIAVKPSVGVRYLVEVGDKEFAMMEMPWETLFDWMDHVGSCYIALSQVFQNCSTSPDTNKECCMFYYNQYQDLCKWGISDLPLASDSFTNWCQADDSNPGGGDGGIGDDGCPPDYTAFNEELTLEINGVAFDCLYTGNVINVKNDFGFCEEIRDVSGLDCDQVEETITPDPGDDNFDTPWSTHR